LTAVYLDSSALVKLVVNEDESPALIAYLADHEVRVASSIATVEVRRAIARRPDLDPGRAIDVLNRLTLVDADRDVLDRAASLTPPELRTLDAIHVATAMGVRDSIEAVVTYDDRLAAAASAHGFRTVSPGTQPA
jgi:uncharacterized protein